MSAQVDEKENAATRLDGKRMEKFQREGNRRIVLVHRDVARRCSLSSASLFSASLSPTS